MSKKKNPPDVTQRSITALKKRFAELEHRVLELEERNFKFADRIQALEERQRPIAQPPTPAH